MELNVKKSRTLVPKRSEKYIKLHLSMKISDFWGTKGHILFSGDFLVTLKVLSSQQFLKILKKIMYIYA